MKLVNFSDLRNGDLFKIYFCGSPDLSSTVYQMINKNLHGLGQILDISNNHLMVLSHNKESYEKHFKYLIVKRKTTEIDDTGMDFL